MQRTQAYIVPMQQNKNSNDLSHPNDGAARTVHMPMPQSVLSGGYEEAGDRGRFLAQTHGDVILHEAFEAHLNRFSAAGATVIDGSLPARCGVSDSAPGRISDLDQVIQHIRTTQVKVLSTIGLIFQQMTSPIVLDWPDGCGARCRRESYLTPVPVGRKARPETLGALARILSGACEHRLQAFARGARAPCSWKRIRHTHEPLASIAVRLGFSDQARMTPRNEASDPRNAGKLAMRCK